MGAALRFVTTAPGAKAFPNGAKMVDAADVDETPRFTSTCATVQEMKRGCLVQIEDCCRVHQRIDSLRAAVFGDVVGYRAV